MTSERAVDGDRPEETLLRMFDEAARWPSIRAAIRAVLKPEERLAAIPEPRENGWEELRRLAEAALSEFDNVRWEDVWANLQVSGAEELAEWTRKYVGYVRADIEGLIAAAKRARDGGVAVATVTPAPPLRIDPTKSEERRPRFPWQSPATPPRQEPAIDVERLAEASRKVGAYSVAAALDDLMDDTRSAIAAEYDRLGSE